MIVVVEVWVAVSDGLNVQVGRGVSVIEGVIVGVVTGVTVALGVGVLVGTSSISAPRVISAKAALRINRTITADIKMINQVWLAVED